jgi:hypothetical protein
VYVSVVGQDGMDVELDAVLANRPAKVSFALEPGCSGAVPAGDYLRDIRAFDADRDRRHDLPVVSPRVHPTTNAFEISTTSPFFGRSILPRARASGGSGRQTSTISNQRGTAS